ncbi:MMPL family transporter [bacterium 3DAC]|nr:MMPL family transporter [bacterium 3DAC]
MDAFADWVYKRRYWIVITVLVLAAISGYIVSTHLKLSYDIMKTIPKDEPAVKAMNILKQDKDMADILTAITPSVSDPVDVKGYIERTKALPDVKDVNWIGDFYDVYQPTEVWSGDEKDMFWKDSYLQTQITLSASVPYGDTVKMSKIIDKIKKSMPPGTGFSSTYVMAIEMQERYQGDIIKYVLWGVLFVLVFLLVTFPSMLIPFVIILSMLLGVLINVSLLSLIKDQVYYLTVTIIVVLQIAVTLDYSLFLYGVYREQRLKKGKDIEHSVITAIKNSFQSILVSMLTTFFGFFALTFGTLTMFKDMGWFLMSGVMISFILTLTFLPATLAILDRLILFLRHPAIEIDPPMGLGRWLVKSATVLVLVFVIIAGSAFYFYHETKMNFDVATFMPNDLPSVQAQRLADDVFGISSKGILLLPKDKATREVFKEFEEIPGVKKVDHYLTALPEGTPKELVPDKLKKQFDGKKYTVAYVEFQEDLLKNSAPVYAVMDKAKQYGGYLTGEQVLNVVLMEKALSDYKKISLIAMGLIFLTVVFGFRSLLIGAALVILIESAIWLNIALFGGKVAFSTPIILGAVQLGATIDYAAYITSRYLHYLRETGDHEEAGANTLHYGFHSIFTSAGTMFLMNLPLAIMSDVPITKETAYALSQGAIVSMIMVGLFAIPLLKFITKVKKGGVYHEA